MKDRILQRLLQINVTIGQLEEALYELKQLKKELEEEILNE